MRGEKTEHVGLLAASAAGDRLAFAALVREYHPLLYRLALHWLGSKRYLADDAMQEAFVAVWRGAHSYLGTGSERAWILSVARRAIMRMHRHKVGEPTHMEDIDALGAKAGMGDRSANVRVLEQLENQDAVRTAFAKIGRAHV